MTHLDFSPTVGGLPVDPVDDGGSVGALVLRELLIDVFTPAVTIPSPAKISTGLYRYTLPDTLPESSYWPQVTWTPTGVASPVVERWGPVTLPGWETTGRVVSPWQVAIHLGLEQPLNDLQTARIADAITAAQGKVEAYLKRPLLPTTEVFTTRVPLSGYDLTDARAWPDVVRDAGDRITVVEAVLDGWAYTVTCLVGLNAATDPALAAIRDFVVADAAGGLNQSLATLGARRVQSVSADGQSVSYEQAGSANDAATPAGSAPTLEGLARWRRRGVYQRRRGPVTAWPYRWV